MSGRKKYLKALALVPAIVLAGGFIGYRAGAFPADFFRLSKKPEPEPQPEPVAAQPPAAPPSLPPVQAADPSFMAGSKSMVITTGFPAGSPMASQPGIVTPQPAQPAPQAAPPAPSPPPAAPPAIIFGSKSAPIFPSQSLNPTSQQPQPPAQPAAPAPKAPKP